MWTYNVKEIVKIYDGDTCTFLVDLGFNITTKIIVRLLGIDTPEIRGEERPEGLIARDWLRERLNTAMLENGIIIKTYKDSKGKYGRYLGTIYIDGVNINMQLIAEGLAEVYK